MFFTDTKPLSLLVFLLLFGALLNGQGAGAGGRGRSTAQGVAVASTVGLDRQASPGRRPEAAQRPADGKPASNLLTLELTIDDWRLYHPRTGWFRPGPSADPTHWKLPGANFWTHREHPAHVRLLEAGGTEVWAGSVGFRLFGGMSRLVPQKSFSLAARRKYGPGKIDYPIFGPAGQQRFDHLVVRNGGSDWGRAYLRDAYAIGLLQDPSWDLDRQRSRPVRVFINGKYWGVYHLREKINPDFLADLHPGVHQDSLDLLEHRATLKHGSIRPYHSLRQFLSTCAPAPTNTQLSQLEQLMDVDNFMRLQIAQTYFDNRDAGGNVRYWRPQTQAGRFRWILYDVDQGFGLHDAEAWRHNTLAFLTAPNGPAWPNPPWSTELQRTLLSHPRYRHAFVNRSLDYLHTDFSAEVAVAVLDEHVAELEGEMRRHLDRWGQTERNWRLHLDRIRTFAERRPAALREHLRDYIDGGPDRAVYLEAGRGGHLLLNENLAVGSDGLAGRYFANLPIHLRAVAEPGYRFAGWEGLSEEFSPDVDVDLRTDRSYRIRATFEPARHPLAGDVIINEVCPRHPGAGDWLELHNRGRETVELRDWLLTDGQNHSFRLPPVRLGAGEYLIVCRDLERFREVYGGGFLVIDGLPFGLNRHRELIGLYSRRGAYVAEMSYRLPELAGPVTLALGLPSLNPAHTFNWVRSADGGTPGGPNPRELATAVVGRQGWWWRLGVAATVLLLIVVFGRRGEGTGG